MRRPALLRCASLSLSQGGWNRCALRRDLRYNRANEIAAEGHDRYGSGLKEASMRRGQLVARRSRQSRRPYPLLLLRIESA
jgi:hypothetical protein